MLQESNSTSPVGLTLRGMRDLGLGTLSRYAFSALVRAPDFGYKGYYRRGAARLVITMETTEVNIV